MMKRPEYTEGLTAQETFEEGMKVLFKVPKAEVVFPKKRRKPASVVKPKKSDKD